MKREGSGAKVIRTWGSPGSSGREGKTVQRPYVNKKCPGRSGHADRSTRNAEMGAVQRPRSGGAEGALARASLPVGSKTKRVFGCFLTFLMIFEVNMKRTNKIQETGSRASQFQGAVMPAHSKRRMGTDDSNAGCRIGAVQRRRMSKVQCHFNAGCAGLRPEASEDRTRGNPKSARVGAQGNRREVALIPLISAAIRAVFMAKFFCHGRKEEEE